MSKYIVAVFNDEKSVYDGVRALDDLDNEATVTFYEGAVIAKDADGTVRVLDWEHEGPIGTLTGMMLGSLVGMIAGPAGMVMGAASGSLGGLMIDAARTGVNDEFLSGIMDELSPGKFALVAEIDEAWTIPLDTAMEKAGGMLFRAWRMDVENEQIDREIEANERELAQLEEEWQQAVDENKAKIQEKIDATKAKFAAMSERINEKLESMKSEYDAKMEKIDQQITKAGEDLKKKLEKARDDLKTDYENRKEKLKKAGNLVAEALS
jgi:uncharacterized membrane protein